MENGRAGVDVAAERPHVRSRIDAIGHDDRPVALLDELDGHDRVGAVRDDSPRRDSHRLTALERPRYGPARCDAGDDRERARGVGRPERKAVHRRAREARQVDRRERVLGQHPAGSGFEGHGLARKRPNAGQHEREGVLDGQETGHGADGTHGVRSAA